MYFCKACKTEKDITEFYKVVSLNARNAKKHRLGLIQWEGFTSTIRITV